MVKKAFYKQNPDFVTREIAGEYILMPLFKSSKELNQIYTLNSTAAFAWKKLDGKTDLARIKDMLLEKFEVSPQKAAGQLSELIKDLKSIKAISAV